MSWTQCPICSSSFFCSDSEHLSRKPDVPSVNLASWPSGSMTDHTKTKSASGHCDLASPKTRGVRVVLGKRLKGEGLSTLIKRLGDRDERKKTNKPKKLQYNRQMQQTHCTVSYCCSTENCTGSAAATANLDTFTNEGEAFSAHEYVITRQGSTFISPRKSAP